MKRLPILALLLFVGCAGKDFWVQGPANVTITSPAFTLSVNLEDGAIYSSTAARREPEPEPEKPKKLKPEEPEVTADP